MTILGSLPGTSLFRSVPGVNFLYSIPFWPSKWPYATSGSPTGEPSACDEPPSGWFNVQRADERLRDAARSADVSVPDIIVIRDASESNKRYARSAKRNALQEWLNERKSAPGLKPKKIPARLKREPSDAKSPTGKVSTERIAGSAGRSSKKRNATGARNTRGPRGLPSGRGTAKRKRLA